MKADIKDIVEKVVRSRFADADIDNVCVEWDTDSDGETILKIIVVYDAKKGLDTSKASGLVRHMRSELEQDLESAFPVIAYRSRADHKRLKSEAA